jgi:hypothetical protein
MTVPRCSRPQQGETMKRTKLWITAVGGLVVGCLLSAVAWAGGQTFTDVGETHPFFDEIEQFAEAGISSGFDDGSYRPGQAVSRQAMAAFMTRGLGQARIASAGTDLATGNPNVAVSALTMNDVNVPGEAGSTQYLWITGNLTWSIDGTKAQACDNVTIVCAFRVEIVVNGTAQNGGIGRIVADRDGGTITVQALVTVGTATQQDVVLRITPLANVEAGELQVDDRQLAVMSVPFRLVQG